MAGNWKMNKTIGEAVSLAQEISNEYENDWAEKVEVVTCTPFVDLKPVVEVYNFDKCNIGVGAQNCSGTEKNRSQRDLSFAEPGAVCKAMQTSHEVCKIKECRLSV